MIDAVARRAVAVVVGSLGIAAFGVPAGATDFNYYTPPKLIKQGTATTAIAGNGTVVVQVLVNPDGSFKVQKIVRSSNPGDNQAAMEMAGTATYAPATKGTKKIVAFYTYTLKFVAGQQTAQASDTSASGASASGSLATYSAQIKSGNYASAKTGLTAYLAAHPADVQAASLLGVADTFTDDFTAAAAAFDKAGASVPAAYKSVEARAYAGAAEKAIAAKDGTGAVAFARKAGTLAPGIATMNLLGNAQIVAGDYPGAVSSFEQARNEIATNPKIVGQQKAVILANLANAYIGADQPDKALPLIKEIKVVDPANASAESALVNYYSKKAQAVKGAQAAALYEQAAAVGPAYAATMYLNEAGAFNEAKDYKSMKTAVDKALALKPDDGNANFLAGVALANDSKPKEAVPYFTKAGTAAKASGDKALADKAEAALKQVNGGK